MNNLPIQSPPVRVEGQITAIKGQLLASKLPLCFVGEEVEWCTHRGSRGKGQVISFHGNDVYIAPYKDVAEISPGISVYGEGKFPLCAIGGDILGNVVDGFGKPLSGKSQIFSRKVPILAAPPQCIRRARIDQMFQTGVRAIDLFLSIGRGQRIGLFSPAGLGKSTLLGMIARRSSADVNVIALIGERGREVNEFILDSLGGEGLQKSVVVVSTSDESAIQRRNAAYTATTIAEHFRDKGKNVLLLFDSLTRTARAIRDLNVACGEVPIRHGFTPGVYAELPKLIERAGRGEQGSITAIYAVLTNNELDLDPLSDEVKSLLDGHIVLSKAMANEGIWPAIDLLQSISRLYRIVQKKETQERCAVILRMIARLQNEKDFVMMGGTPDPELACAIHFEERFRKLRSQSTNADMSCQTAEDELNALFDAIQDYQNK